MLDNLSAYISQVVHDAEQRTLAAISNAVSSSSCSAVSCFCSDNYETDMPVVYQSNSSVFGGEKGSLSQSNIMVDKGIVFNNCSNNVININYVSQNDSPQSGYQAPATITQSNSAYSAPAAPQLGQISQSNYAYSGALAAQPSQEVYYAPAATYAQPQPQPVAYAQPQAISQANYAAAPAQSVLPPSATSMPNYVPYTPQNAPVYNQQTKYGANQNAAQPNPNSLEQLLYQLIMLLMNLFQSQNTQDNASSANNASTASATPTTNQSNTANTANKADPASFEELVKMIESLLSQIGAAGSQPDAAQASSANTSDGNTINQSNTATQTPCSSGTEAANSNAAQNAQEAQDPTALNTAALLKEILSADANHDGKTSLREIKKEIKDLEKQIESLEKSGSQFAQQLISVLEEKLQTLKMAAKIYPLLALEETLKGNKNPDLDADDMGNIAQSSATDGNEEDFSKTDLISYILNKFMANEEEEQQ